MSEEFMVDGCRVEISQDPYYEGPDVWGNEICFLVSFLPRDLWVTRKGLESPQDLKDWTDDYHVVPVSAYIHSGIVLSVSGDTYPVTCRWDTTRGAVFALLSKKYFGPDKGKNASVSAAAEALIEEWNMYLGGDVWSYTVEDPSGNVVDSLAGIYGREYAETEARESANHYAKPYKRLVEIVQEGDLDELVHDSFDSIAESVNTDGTESQIKTLLKHGYTVQQIAGDLAQNEEEKP